MTKTHVIDGVTYVEVDREAKVGDKVLIVNADFTYDMYKNGDILTAEGVSEVGIYSQSVAYVGKDGSNSSGCIYTDEYVVLEPQQDEVSTVDTSEASPAVIEMLTSLSRKIVSLESQLRDTQNNVEKQARSSQTHATASPSTPTGSQPSRIRSKC
jgi:hypothetical protein